MKLILFVVMTLLSTNVIAQSAIGDIIQKDNQGRALFKQNKKIDHSTSSPCSQVINANDQVLDMSCPLFFPFEYDDIYASDEAGNFMGGKLTQCKGYGFCYSYIASQASAANTLY
jgi:hypothetical protein